MATKRVYVPTNEFIKVNNGGLVDTNKFIMQALSGEVLVGTTDANTNPPSDEDCYRIKDDFSYTGSDDVYVKSLYRTVTVIVDKV